MIKQFVLDDILIFLGVVVYDLDVGSASSISGESQSNNKQSIAGRQAASAGPACY